MHWHLQLAANIAESSKRSHPSSRENSWIRDSIHTLLAKRTAEQEIQFSLVWQFAMFSKNAWSSWIQESMDMILFVDLEWSLSNWIIMQRLFMDISRISGSLDMPAWWDMLVRRCKSLAEYCSRGVLHLCWVAFCPYSNRWLPSGVCTLFLVILHAAPHGYPTELRCIQDCMPLQDKVPGSPQPTVSMYATSNQ